MTVAAFLPPRLLRHVQFILGREHPPLVVESWDRLEELIRAQPVSVAIIDPSTDGVAGTEKIEEILADYPSVPVIAYVTVTAPAFRAVAELSRAGLKHVILYSFDDSPERFLGVLDTVRANPLTVQLLAAFRPSLNKLPVSLVRTVEDMFAEPHRYVSASDIATSAKIPLVRLYRALHAAGVGSPKRLLVAAKLLRAYGYLADPGQSVRGVSRKLGYRHTRIFADHTFEVFRFTPSRVRDHMTEDQVVARLVIWMNAGDAKGELETEASRAIG
jgi:AraC-like DNA-binding protein